ncbi:MAG: hypothetical protein WCC74_02995 [Minisyncoccia bacterium]
MEIGKLHLRYFVICGNHCGKELEGDILDTPIKLIISKNSWEHIEGVGIVCDECKTKFPIECRLVI